MPHTTTMTRRLLTGFAAASLALGLTACAGVGDDTRLGDDSPEQTGAEHTTPEGADTENPGDIGTVTDTTAGVQDEDADHPRDTRHPEPTEEIDLLDGGTADVPAPLAEAVNTYSTDFGQATEVEEGSERKYLVSFDEGNHLAYSEETDAQPLGGEIAQAWVDEGGLDSDLGLPTGPEEITEDEGRTQEFVNGTITVGPDGNTQIEQN